MPMNILVVHPSLNAGGGSEKVCLTMIEALKERGYNVTLWTFEEPNWESIKKFFGSFIKPDAGVVHQRFFGSTAYGELLNFHKIFSRTPKGYERIIISSSSPWFYCPTEGKVIIYLNLVPVNYFKGLKRAYLIPYVSLQRRFLKKTQSKILTNSLFSSRVFERIYSLKPFVIYPPVDVERFSSKPKENLVISVGRFDPFKKYEILIEAFSQIKDGRFFILGSIHSRTSVRYFNKLRMLIKRFKVNGKVKLIVNSPFNVLKNILSRAKIYVHCSPFEYFGMSVVEAMACGCVPIVYRSGGAYLDVIDKGNYGLAFSNTNELIDGINLLLKDDHLFRNLSQKVIERPHIFSKQNFKKNFLKFVD